MDENDKEIIKKIVQDAIAENKRKYDEEYSWNIMESLYSVIMVIGIVGVLMACFGFIYYGNLMFIAGCVMTFIAIAGLITYENMITTRKILSRMKRDE